MRLSEALFGKKQHCYASGNLKQFQLYHLNNAAPPKRITLIAQLVFLKRQTDLPSHKKCNAKCLSTSNAPARSNLTNSA